MVVELHTTCFGFGDKETIKNKSDLARDGSTENMRDKIFKEGGDENAYDRLILLLLVEKCKGGFICGTIKWRRWRVRTIEKIIKVLAFVVWSNMGFPKEKVIMG